MNCQLFSKVHADRLVIMAMLPLSACMTPMPDNSLPHTGNVQPEAYVHVSGAVNKRNANVETAQLLGTVTVGAAVGVGVANAAGTNIVTVPVIVPNSAQPGTGAPAANSGADCLPEISKQ